MKNTLQYISAKTVRKPEGNEKPLYGTGTIVQSGGRYYLLTAYHCAAQIDNEGNEIIKADWHLMSATVYTQDDEIKVEVIGFVDADIDQDWVIFEINKPNIPNLDTYKFKFSLDIAYGSETKYSSYGFPHAITDGLYIDFTPSNNRGTTWRIHDTVEGGNIKAITLEKGASGMGLFRKDGNQLYCNRLINKSVPDGSMNAMKSIPVSYFMHKFSDDVIGENEIRVPSISESKESSIVENINNSSIQKAFIENYRQLVLQADFKSALPIIKKLYETDRNNENLLLNYIYVLSMAEPTSLSSLIPSILTYHFSSSENLLYVVNRLSVNGQPEAAVEIFYNHCIQANDEVLDSLFYSTVALNSTLSAISRKEYQEVEEGRCVLYEDESLNRHAFIVTSTTTLGNALLHKQKNDVVNVELVGENKRIKIIAIFSKYYIIEHRAIHNLFEHGGNQVMPPFKLDGSLSDEGKVQQLMTFLESFGPHRSIKEQMEEEYKDMPSLLLTANVAGDLVSGYYFLMTDGIDLISWPLHIMGGESRLQYINDGTEFVLDLSSFIKLSEKYFADSVVPPRKFIIASFLKAVVEEFCKTAMTNTNFVLHQALSSGRLHKFSDDPIENMRMRIDGLRRFMAECCEEKSCHIPVNIPKQTHPENTNMLLLFLNTTSLLYNNPDRVLITEDWYYFFWLEGLLFMINSEEYCSLGTIGKC